MQYLSLRLIYMSSKSMNARDSHRAASKWHYKAETTIFNGTRIINQEVWLIRQGEWIGTVLL